MSENTKNSSFETSCARLELLAPAKNSIFGKEAINHGADAVYIGGPAFGARAGAGNSVSDIADLAQHAHRYRAKVLVALNTILKDEELEPAREIIWQLHDAGVDALIIQDMGLLEMDLPPIELHASTQADIRSVEKAVFLERVGFSQMVLARELSLAQIEAISVATPATLEFFIHGALCVSYSGQCYISHAHTGRSANRGECSQACRLPYDLADTDGNLLARGKHLLSMKDNDQSANLESLILAGIRSFKIEGRLKDLSYVKNITAHYRTLLDGLIDQHAGWRRSSTGRSEFSFVPQPEKTFNRGATDYFLNGRQADIAAFDSPKFVGEAVGKVTQIGGDFLLLDTQQALNNGDGISYFDTEGELHGMRVNRVDGKRLFPLLPGGMPEGLGVGTLIYRNRDQDFERALEKHSADRRVRLNMHLSDDAAGLNLMLSDEDGVRTQTHLPMNLEAARDTQKAMRGLEDGLAKLGGTMFEAGEISFGLTQAWFVPASVLNGLRRQAVSSHEAARIASHPRAGRKAPLEPAAQYPQQELSYLGNVYNASARRFYEKHGVCLIEDAYEANQEKGLVSLMITKHCLRYNFNLCPREVKGIKPDPMTLVRGGEKLLLRFDCKRCEMHVVGKLKKNQRTTL